MDGLAKLRRNVYHNGPDYKDLIQVKSHLTSETINRYTHIHQSKDAYHNDRFTSGESEKHNKPEV